MAPALSSDELPDALVHRTAATLAVEHSVFYAVWVSGGSLKIAEDACKSAVQSSLDLSSWALPQEPDSTQFDKFQRGVTSGRYFAGPAKHARNIVQT